MSAFADLKTRISSLPVFKTHPGEDYPPLGIYPYRREGPDEKTRIHLRVDPDGRGLIMVNASHVYHLNPTAATMAYLALQEVPEPEAIQALRRKYRLSAAQARTDYAQFVGQLDALLHPDGPCPIHDLELETTLPFSARPSAPYRMDLALTYRCNNACAHCYNDRPRDHPELDTSSWLSILDRLWALHIPHVVFTGGEPTLRSDLPELVAHAEHNGQITGLNTNGRRLQDRRYVEALVDAGLDHVQITLESHDPEIHERMVARKGAWKQTVAGIRNALESRLFVMTNTTLLEHNSPVLGETLDFLAELGVPTVGLNALIYSGRGLTVGTGLPEEALPPLLELARQRTDLTGQKLIWYTPTEYCNFDPVQLDLGVKGCTAALYNMCVESDGSVIPCQSYYQPLGNLLEDPWDSIWNHDLAVSLRERRDLPGKCLSCALLPECGGGCPLRR
ncbi:MAG: radical SAM protein [Chloroflexi bacterium]|nr:radical SAM protein [Chloroflexota bacterium]